MLKIKIFQENRESFLDYISEKTVIFIQNTEDLFCIRQSLLKPKKLWKII
jgi:hypothetical protein